MTPAHFYLNYDATSDRRIIKAEEWNRDTKLVIFDELHKMKKWKSWIKGIYDTEGTSPSLLVTGSARLDTYRKGGESLAGRFFYYRLHPLTVKEICHYLGEDSETALDKLVKLGGFPEPYIKDSETFAKRFRRIHYDTGAVEGDLGAKLENMVACALLRELHLIEDTTGSRVALHYLRDKEKHEVDFLPVVDNRPLCMLEVKVGDENFSPSLFRFHSKLKTAKPFQIVYGLKYKKSKDSARMLPAHEFLRDFQLSQDQLQKIRSISHRIFIK